MKHFHCPTKCVEESLLDQSADQQLGYESSSNWLIDDTEQTSVPNSQTLPLGDTQICDRRASKEDTGWSATGENSEHICEKGQVFTYQGQCI